MPTKESKKMKGQPQPLITWWLDQYNLHNWLKLGLSSSLRKATADSNSTRNSAQNSAAFLYIAYNKSHLILGNAKDR